MAGLIGSIIGSGQQSSDDAEAAALQAQALQNLQNLNVPTVQSEQLALENEQSAGQLNPEDEGAVQLQGNSYDNISSNPQLVAAQMQALQSLQQQGNSGLTASDKANLQQIVNQQEQTANSQNQGTLQQFAQRGQGGSGANLAAELANNQNAANNANNQSLQIAGQAQQNALQATAQAGSLGTNIENQQYSQAANKAQAQNAINQFNAQNSQNVQNTNTQAKNQAQVYNLNNAQNISNTNTGTANQQQQYNSNLQQQNFEDQVQKAGGIASESNSLAGTNMQTGANQNQNTNAIFGQVGDIAGQAGGGVGNMIAAYKGGVIPHFDNGGSVVPAYGKSLMDFLNNKQKMGITSADKPMQGSQPDDTSSDDSTSSSNPLSSLISKLSPSSSGSSLNGSSSLQMPELGSGNFAATAAPTLAEAKGGMIRPPTPGNSMSMFRMLNKGGQIIPAKVSPGEKYLTPTEVEQVENGKVSPKETGTKVPGKAKVKGDSPENDTVDAKLQAGGLVIPRSIVGQKDDVIMDFIRAAKLHAKGGK
jgi:flavin-binding protein dodecin